jgi:hypothetical protein
MREGTTSRVTAADRPCGEFYDFYSVSPKNFGSTLVVRGSRKKTPLSAGELLGEPRGGSFYGDPEGYGEEYSEDGHHSPWGGPAGEFAGGTSAGDLRRL